MKKINLCDSSTLDTLSEDERRALRGSRFAPLPLQPSCEMKAKSRVAHPSGPVATNKAAALAKFLQRKLDKSSGSANLDPVLVEAAVENCKATLRGLSSNALNVRHVETFSDSNEECEAGRPDEVRIEESTKKKKKKKKRNKACPVLQSPNDGGSSHKAH